MPTKPPEGTRWLELTPTKLKELWEKMDAISGLFDDFSRGNFKLFCSRLQAPNSIWVETEDSNGLFYATDVRPGLSATGHLVFFDKKLRGKEELSMDLIRFLITGAGLKKVNVYLPDYAGAAMHFVERMGFRKEGCLRRWSYSKGRLYDMHLYGITREEAFNGTGRLVRDKARRDGVGSGHPVKDVRDGDTPGRGTGEPSDAAGDRLVEAAGGRAGTRA